MCFISDKFSVFKVVRMILQEFVCNRSLIHVFYIAQSILLFIVQRNSTQKWLRIAMIKSQLTDDMKSKIFRNLNKKWRYYKHKFIRHQSFYFLRHFCTTSYIEMRFLFEIYKSIMKKTKFVILNEIFWFFDHTMRIQLFVNFFDMTSKSMLSDFLIKFESFIELC
jgi:hypothetical protein